MKVLTDGDHPKKRGAAVLISPVHLVGLMSAVRHYHGAAGSVLDLFVNWPGGPTTVINEVAAAIRTMAQAFPEVRTVTAISNDDVAAIYGAEPSPTGRSDVFRERFAPATFDEIYYPFDVVGEIYRLLAGANPTARRIWTGENLGHVFERAVYFSLLPPPAQPAQSRLRRIRALGGAAVRRMERRLRPQPAVAAPIEYPPDEAALLLPVDQSGGVLRRLPFVVPERWLAIEIVQEASTACRELDEYCKTLLETHPGGRRYVLCTQNYAEGKFISFDREIGMWCEAVRRYCEPGATIFHKPHPGEQLPRGQAVARALAGEFTVVELAARFRCFPIEIWPRLVRAVTVISGSNPLLSLKYLYDVDSIQPFDSSVIERWFPPEMWIFFNNAISLFSEPLARYPEWDGRSVLWTGSLSRNKR
jgi:hypothetical protein